MSIETYKTFPLDTPPEDTLVDSEGNVVVAEDAGATDENVFLYEDEKRRLEQWEDDARKAANDSEMEVLMENERPKDLAKADIQAQLAVIAVKTYTKLSDQVLEAHQRGDIVEKQRVLKRLDELSRRFPGIANPENFQHEQE